MVKSGVKDKDKMSDWAHATKIFTILKNFAKILDHKPY